MPFGAGQGRAQAVVDAVAEGHLAFVAAKDVEAVGFGELLGVSVGGALHGPEGLSPAQPLAMGDLHARASRCCCIGPRPAHTCHGDGAVQAGLSSCRDRILQAASMQPASSRRRNA